MSQINGRRVVTLAVMVAAAASALALEGEGLPGSAANIPAGPAGSAAPAGAPTSGSSSSNPSPSQSANLPAGKPAERLREGTRLIDVAGTFQSIGGENVTFTPVGQANLRDSFRVLENLALQRVSQVLDKNQVQRQWVVSGVVTEFRDVNYLLLTKAVALEPEAAAP